MVSEISSVLSCDQELYFSNILLAFRAANRRKELMDHQGEERQQFKMDFYNAFENRCHDLVKQKRNVLIVGDVNTGEISRKFRRITWLFCKTRLNTA